MITPQAPARMQTFSGAALHPFLGSGRLHPVNRVKRNPNKNSL